MNITEIVGDSHEARMIVDAMMMDKTLAEDAMTVFAEEGLTGDSLAEYYREHYYSRSVSMHESVHDMARAAVFSLRASEDI